MWAYIVSQLPEDAYPGVESDEVVKLFRQGQCPFDQVLLRYCNLIKKLSVSKGIKGYDHDDMFQEYSQKLYNCCYSWAPDKSSFVTYFTNAAINHWKRLLRTSMTEAARINMEELISLDQAMEDDEGSERKIAEPYVEMEMPAELLLMGIDLTEQERRYCRLILADYRNTDISQMEGVSRTRVSNVLRGIGRKLLEMGEDLRG